MSRRILCILFLVFVLALTQTACQVLGGVERRDEIVKTFDLKSGNSVTVHNVNGRIVIEAWDQEKVEVHAIKTAHGYDGRDAEENLKRVEVVFDASPNEVKIDTRYPSTFHWGGGVEYSLRVPRKASLNLRTTNGSIQVSDVQGQIELQSTNGSVSAENIGGSLRASTTNGKVSATFTQFSDQGIRLSTTNGGIELALPDDVNANITARTTNGSIKTDFPITTRGTVGRHSLDGTLGKGGAAINLHTTNGGIRITRTSSKTV